VAGLSTEGGSPGIVDRDPVLYMERAEQFPSRAG
jgi:hypothetical protein